MLLLVVLLLLLLHVTFFMHNTSAGLTYGQAFINSGRGLVMFVFRAWQGIVVVVVVVVVQGFEAFLRLTVFCVGSSRLVEYHSTGEHDEIRYDAMLYCAIRSSDQSAYYYSSFKSTSCFYSRLSSCGSFHGRSSHEAVSGESNKQLPAAVTNQQAPRVSLPL